MLLTWFPLLVLSASQGLALHGKVQIPFLFDLIQHARFLVALPLAIWAEAYISPRFEMVLNRFLIGQVISSSDIPRYQKAVLRVKSLNDSLVAEIVILVFSYLYISLGLQRGLSLGLSSWNHFGVAKYWYLWVSLPIFIFVWIRWIWRQMIWAIFLFRTSRMDLQLISTHPDHVGGLAFVTVAQRRFAVLVFAISAIASASIAEEIIYGGATLRTFESELVAFFVICMFVVLGPLIVFSPLLIRTKLKDWGRYSLFAVSYTRDFDEKWIQRNELNPNELLGTPDIQSLSDLRNSFEGISKMRTLLPDRQTVIILLIAFCLPIAPLLMTVIPLRQILSELLSLLTK